jgi:hypothetical protein
MSVYETGPLRPTTMPINSKWLSTTSIGAKRSLRLRRDMRLPHVEDPDVVRVVEPADDHATGGLARVARGLHEKEVAVEDPGARHRVA